MNNDDWKQGQNVTIFGHGTLCGDKLTHPASAEPPEKEAWRYG